MIADSLSLSKDSATDVDTNLTVYVKRYADAGKSEFAVAGLTKPIAAGFKISHDIGKGGEERHLVSINETLVDAALVPATQTWNLTCIRPPNTAITQAMILANLNKLIDFCIEGGVNANIVAVLNGEV